MSIKFIKIFFRILYKILPILLSLFGIVLIIAGVLARLEHLTFWNAVYFAWITAATVGYGDITPHTAVSKILCMFLVIIGVATTGIIAAVAVNAGRIAFESSPEQ